MSKTMIIRLIIPWLKAGIRDAGNYRPSPLNAVTKYNCDNKFSDERHISDKHENSTSDLLIIFVCDELRCPSLNIMLRFLQHVRYTCARVKILYARTNTFFLYMSLYGVMHADEQRKRFWTPINFFSRFIYNCRHFVNPLAMSRGEGGGENTRLSPQTYRFPERVHKIAKLHVLLCNKRWITMKSATKTKTPNLNPAWKTFHFKKLTTSINFIT